MSRRASFDNESPVLARLRDAVRLLAQPAPVQLARLPAAACRADEMALDFEHWRSTALQLHGDLFRAGQREALARLDRLLAEMSGEERAASWTDVAVRESEEWCAVREAARGVLASFGWPDQSPPPDAVL